MNNAAQDGQRSFKVPKENNRFLCWPPATQTQQLLDRNLQRRSKTSLPLWLSDLRVLARQQAIEATHAYISQYAPTLITQLDHFDAQATQLIVGGHQPELFHPGVWFKNFLLDEIAARSQSTALHVIIDHDVARSDTLRVPCKTSGEYFQQSIPLPVRPESDLRMPWHATPTMRGLDANWAQATEHIRQSMASCGVENSILAGRSQWLTQSMAETANIGDAFSRFRHRIEIEHGVRNLEVPISHLCAQSAFGLFVFHCAKNASGLWQSYNSCRQAYRERHSIRNQAQPVLELQRQGEQLELPFWIYQTKDAPHVERKRLWIDSSNGTILLCDHPDRDQRSLSISLPDSESDLPQVWTALAVDGICIRPRALMTTMYLRCLVADLFVHGIGGGTYDELTDDIIRNWLGIDAPEYITTSASLHLPIPEPTGSTSPASDWAAIQRELQLLRSVPERFLDLSNADSQALKQAHAELLTRIPERGHKRAWHLEIAQIKHRIEASIEIKKSAVHTNQESLIHQLQQDKIRKSREYSFVLFPEADIVSRLASLADEAVNPV